MSEEKKHLSASQINCYLRCPMQYYYRYIKNLTLPPRSALTLGSSVHAGIAHNYNQKKKSRKDLKVNTILDVYCQSFDMGAKETEWQKDEKPGEVKDQGIELLKVYHSEISPQIQPVEVEQKFEVDFPNVDYGFVGYVDLVDDKNRIIDHKTTARTPNGIASDHRLQLTGYSLGYRAGTGKKEKKVRIDYLVKNKHAKVVTLEEKISDGDVDRLLKLMAYVAKAIDQELFYPQPHNFMCCPNGCGYWDICHQEF